MHDVDNVPPKFTPTTTEEKNFLHYFDEDPQDTSDLCALEMSPHNLHSREGLYRLLKQIWDMYSIGATGSNNGLPMNILLYNSTQKVMYSIPKLRPLRCSTFLVLGIWHVYS